MTQLQITLLGPFCVSHSSEQETEFESNKVRALLAYLAVEQGQQPRGKLATLFWPDHDETNARTNLRQVLYQLRRSIGDETADPPYLLISRQSIGLNPAAAYTIDVSSFRTLLAATATHTHEQLTGCTFCLDRLRQAVALYRSDFLTGFALDDSDIFEEWRRITQEQLHLQALEALHQLTTAATIARDTTAILQHARHQLRLEPWREEAHWQIIRTLAESGQRAAALAQYKLCCDVLAAELGVGPDVATVSLYEQIRQGQITQNGVPQAGRESPQAPRTPRSYLPIQLTTFVGREEELN